MAKKKYECEDIICTYCYERFNPSEVKMHYRLDENLPREDGGIDEDEDALEEEFSMTRRADHSAAASGKTLDELMYKFYTDRMRLPENDARMNSMQNDYVIFDSQNDDFKYDESKFDKYGFVESLKYKGISAKRICPFCHNPLVSGAGTKKMVLISVIGDTNSGKTVYFSALQRFLSDRLMYIGEASTEDYNFFSSNTTLPQATNLRPLPSCTMLYTMKNPDGERKEIILVFCDIAGENTRNSNSLERTAFNLPNSSGLLFMIDPTRFTEIAQILGRTDVATDDQHKIFTAMYNYFRTGEKKLDTPTAVVITKSDVLQAHQYFQSDPEKMKLVVPTGVNEHSGCINNKIIDRVDQVTRDFLRSINEGAYVNNAESVFSNQKFFMVSSLGYDPVLMGDNSDIVPNRVTEPFEWLMCENGASYIHYKGAINYEVEVPKLMGLISKKETRTANLDFYYTKDEELRGRISREIRNLSKQG